MHSLCRLTTVLLLVFVSGCSAAMRAASLGDQALERKDLPGAALHYRDACQLAPQDAFYCKRATELFQKLEREVIAQARPACEAKAPLQCLTAVERARTINTSPELDALAGEAGQQWVELCQREPLDSPLRALHMVRCLEAVRPQVRLRSFDEQVTVARLKIAAWVRQSADAERAAGRVAGGLALTSLARCFAREPNSEQQLEQSYLAFLAKTAVPVAIGVDGGLLDTARMCDVLPGMTKGRVLCGVKGRAAQLALRLALVRGQLDEQVADDYKDIEYEASREQYLNPEWQTLQSRVYRLEQQERIAATNARIAQDSCDAARRALSQASYCNNCSERNFEKSSCASSSTYDDAHRDTKRALSDAESTLRRTDKMLVRRIMDRFRYIEREHTWRQPYRVYFAASGSEVLSTLDTTMDLTAKDTEHPGFEPAQLEPKSARPPRVGDFDEDMRGRFLSRFAAWLEPELKNRSDAKKGTCTGDPLLGGEGLDCVLTAAFLEGKDPAKELVALMSQRLDSASGWAQYPKAGCVE